MPFARNDQHGKELLMLNDSLMREHEDRALTPPKRIQVSQEDRQSDIVHLDKTRAPRRHFLNGNNLESLQTEEMRAVTENQRATCDILYVAMFRLHYPARKNTWEDTTLEQRHILYRDVRKQMPLVVDRLIYPNERKSVDIGSTHTSSTPLAEKYGQLCEYKFLRPCEATMYYRMWKFENWEEPVYDLFKTVALDTTIKDGSGLSLDVMDIPGNHAGRRGIKGQQRALPQEYGAFNLSSYKRKA